MLITDVNTDEMYKITIDIYQNICKNHVLPTKIPRKHQTQKDDDIKKYHNFKRKYKGQQIIKPEKIYQIRL